MKLLAARRPAFAGIGVAVAVLGATATLSTSAAYGGGPRLSSDLNGAAVVPGPGDPDGTGRADIRIRAARGEVCYEVSVEKITPSTWAAIHHAPAGAVGPEVVYMIPPSPEVVLSTGEVIGGYTSGCTYVDRAVAKDILRHPDQYYVNVQNAGFLDGAVRGQLGK
jgi:hypothetical protein